MAYVHDKSAARLRVAMILALVGSILMVLRWVVTYVELNGQPLGRDPVFWMILFSRSILMPLAMVVTAVYLRRGSYGAMTLLIVLSSMTLLQATRLSNVIHAAWSLCPLLVLFAALWARPAMAAYPDFAAADRARRRSAVMLPIAAVAAAFAVFMTLIGILNMLTRTPHASILTVIAAVSFALMGTAGSLWLFRMAGVARRRERQSTITVVLFVIAAGVLLQVSGGMGYLVYVFTGVIGAISVVQVVYDAFMVTLIVDVIHARRKHQEPASYGFEPIFARPVEPLTPTAHLEEGP